jgi:predicted nucleic acid-binding protein
MVLADTGPLFAAIDPSDQHHDRSTRELRALARGGWQVAVAHTTLIETHRVILHNLGVRHARAWIADAAASLAPITPLASDFSRAIEVVSRFRDQEFTLFDTLVYVIAQQLDVPIWTYDHHFDILRANRWQL